jgi:hypothetical protein
VLTAYALSFRSLLLFCGRLADLVGRKVTFLAGHSRAAQPPLLPQVVLDRNRGGACLTRFINGAGMFASLLFLIYYLQVSPAYSAVKSGAASASTGSSSAARSAPHCSTRSQPATWLATCAAGQPSWPSSRRSTSP